MLNYSFTYTDLEYFLLVLIRVSCFFSVAPFFSMSNTPRRVRVGLSVLVAVLLYQAIPHSSLFYNTILGYFVIVMKEALVGLLIGFAANLCSS